MTQASSSAEAAILHARARALAVRTDAATDPAETGAMLEILVFRLAGERYAVETRFVHGMHTLRGMTPLPCAPACVTGVVNVRGHVVPVIGFRQLLGLADGDPARLASLVLVGTGDMEAGLPAEAGAAVTRVPATGLQPGLPGFSTALSTCVRGITADGVTLLDIAGLFAHPLLEAATAPGADAQPTMNNGEQS